MPQRSMFLLGVFNILILYSSSKSFYKLNGHDQQDFKELKELIDKKHRKEVLA